MMATHCVICHIIHWAHGGPWSLISSSGGRDHLQCERPVDGGGVGTGPDSYL